MFCYSNRVFREIGVDRVAAIRISSQIIIVRHIGDAVANGSAWVVLITRESSICIWLNKVCGYTQFDGIGDFMIHICSYWISFETGSSDSSLFVSNIPWYKKFGFFISTWYVDTSVEKSGLVVIEEVFVVDEITAGLGSSESF